MFAIFAYGFIALVLVDAILCLAAVCSGDKPMPIPAKVANDD